MPLVSLQAYKALGSAHVRNALTKSRNCRNLFAGYCHGRDIARVNDRAGFGRSSGPRAMSTQAERKVDAKEHGADVKVKETNRGFTTTDVIACLALFGLSTAFLLNEVKDLPVPQPKKKKTDSEEK
mmetsp:Transcript_1176/g.1880  ORF Transcript_1176/g.1880 Transcript_1176/m.1880 type:complete len:126 (+) Transcript_1176:78-455(+)